MRLTRDSSRRLIAGICAGIAEHYHYDVSLIRVLAVLLAIPWGFGIVLYLALWMLMPTGPAATARSTQAADPSFADADPSPDSPEPSSIDEDRVDALRTRASRAAHEFTLAARSAAEVARGAGGQLLNVARAATEAGREAWRRERDGASPDWPHAHGPVAVPPPHEVVGAPGPDDTHAEEAPHPGV